MAGAMGPSTLGWWFSPWEPWGGQAWLVDIVVLPMGLQTSSAPSVLLLALSVGFLDQSDGWM